jgi:hypothetical protein
LLLVELAKVRELALLWRLWVDLDRSFYFFKSIEFQKLKQFNAVILITTEVLIPSILMSPFR